MNYRVDRASFLAFQTKSTTSRVENYGHAIKTFKNTVTTSLNAFFTFFTTDTFFIIYLYLNNHSLLPTSPLRVFCEIHKTLRRRMTSKLKKIMCLIKVYLDKEKGRKLVARDVALIVKEGSKVTLKSVELKELATIEGVDISLIDTLNSIMIVEPKK